LVVPILLRIVMQNLPAVTYLLGRHLMLHGSAKSPICAGTIVPAMPMMADP
jgi:ABC-type proline/glycine betaine transport system permease subunit